MTIATASSPAANVLPADRAIPIAQVGLIAMDMDSTAITMCMEHKLPILVLNLWDEQALKHALFGNKVGTLVH